MPASRHLVLALALLVGAASAVAARTERSPERKRGDRPMAHRAECLPETRRTLSPCFAPAGAGPVRVAFFDADSTLRVSRSGNVSANHPTDVLLLPRVARKLRKLQREGWLLAVVSNQGGVEYGYVTVEDADAALRYTLELLLEEGVLVHMYDFAEASDEYRKPRTGMADAAERAVREALRRGVDWKASFMVGDSGWKRGKDVEPFGTPGEDFSNSDRGFAENVRRAREVPGGFRFYHPRDFFGWTHFGVRNFRNHEDLERFREENPGI